MNTLNNKFKFIFSYWFPVFVWAGIIFTFSSFPTGKATHIDWQDFIVKKTAHIVEYAVFTMLLYRALINSGVSKVRAAVIAVFSAMLYGASDEFHQSFTAGREPRLRDVGFDTIGSLLSIYGIWNIVPKLPEKLKSLAKQLELT